MNQRLEENLTPSKIAADLLMAGMLMATEENKELSNLGFGLVEMMQAVQDTLGKFDAIDVLQTQLPYLHDLKSQLGKVQSPAAKVYQNQLQQSRRRMGQYLAHQEMNKNYTHWTH